MNDDDKIAYKEIIKDFINGDEKELKMLFHPMNDFCELLSELSFNTKRDGSINLAHDGNSWDTNGWQVDFWWTFHREGKKYMLAGSLFYGDITLSKEDGKDEE